MSCDFLCLLSSNYSSIRLFRVFSLKIRFFIGNRILLEGNAWRIRFCYEREISMTLAFANCNVENPLLLNLSMLLP